eukprot:NODE_285_length_1047_cov_62.924850_g243_i0.p1 GENE.NODE_285_length_1047_cov_62.924850_g243_i0~~NODE_285_length_1047_cov_62.924850_g243_i0.p1  ORF type:complete len:252 (+),score=79.01 NODE_285_length_1047_cov_62.924850_g243_i0:24-758(+)
MGNSGTCETHGKATVKATGHLVLPQNEDQIAAFVAQYGPVSISIFAMTDIWWPYTGGIMEGCCANQADHAILLVGYGEDAGKKYWWVKNSWSNTWGEDGYVRMARGSNECGITQAAVFALVEGGPQPPPSPPSTYCAPDAILTHVAGNDYTCMWKNNTNGVKIPADAKAVCYYFKDGDMGWEWPAAEGGFDKFPCPKSSSQNYDYDRASCQITSGYNGAIIPQNAAPLCDQLSSGMIGYKWTQE